MKLADESFCIGPAVAKESYLNTSKILEIIEKTGTEAVHPGYGFLSENAAFVEMLVRLRLSTKQNHHLKTF